MRPRCKARETGILRMAVIYHCMYTIVVAGLVSDWSPKESLSGWAMSLLQSVRKRESRQTRDKKAPSGSVFDLNRSW